MIKSSGKLLEVTNMAEMCSTEGKGYLRVGKTIIAE